MMHPQIENDEIVERYVQRTLAREQQDAFEEHLFGCSECFEKVQDAERFRAGIRQASVRGLLDDDATIASRGSRWMIWTLAATTCAAAACIAIAGWMYFNEIPRLRRELDRSITQLALERQVRTERPVVASADAAEANTPLVILQASRASEKPITTELSPESKRLVVWIEIGPSRYRRFQIELFSTDNRRVASVTNLERGPYGALVASLPAEKLPSGALRITLTGQDPGPASVVGDYQLTIHRQ